MTLLYGNLKLAKGKCAAKSRDGLRRVASAAVAVKGLRFASMNRQRAPALDRRPRCGCCPAMRSMSAPPFSRELNSWLRQARSGIFGQRLRRLRGSNVQRQYEMDTVNWRNSLQFNGQDHKSGKHPQSEKLDCRWQNLERLEPGNSKLTHQLRLQSPAL